MRICARNLIFAAAVLSIVGCVTGGGGSGALSEKATKSFANDFNDPRRYWLNVHRASDDKPTVQGGFRLHLRQVADLPIKRSKVPFRPFVGVKNTAFEEELALLDIASPECWVDYTMHNELGLITLGYDGAFPYDGMRDTGGVPAYMAVRTQLRFDQLFIENILFYTRLESGSLGPIDRGITDRRVNFVLGWDLLKKFELIQFNFGDKNMHFGVSDRYNPTEKLLMGEVRITPIPGQGCVVMGDLEGEPQLFVVDPVGDFEIAWPGRSETSLKQISFGDLIFRDAAISDVKVDGKLPRIGGRLLSKYVMTLCPKNKVIYFERPLPD